MVLAGGPHYPGHKNVTPEFSVPCPIVDAAGAPCNVRCEPLRWQQVRQGAGEHDELAGSVLRDLTGV
jgi:hypothetical protein